MNTFVGTFIIGALVIIVLVLFAFALYEWSQLNSLNTSLSSNPYCVRQACVPGSTQIPAYQIPPADDPLQTSYQTMNYCLVNAPPCEIISAVAGSTGATGATGATGPLSTDQLTQILAFYNQDYYPNCSYLFGGGNTVKTNPNGPEDPPANSTDFVNGPNDAFLINLLSYSYNSGVGCDNSDWVSLVNACGPQCSSLAAECS